MKTLFADRHKAGKELAKKLRHYAFHSDVLVLALPRGGVPVGFEVAASLHAPLNVFIVRKLGVPFHQEYAMGAVASGGSYFLNENVLRQLHISREEVDNVLARETMEIKRRAHEYGTTPLLEIENRTVILVDDGLATGSTMRAAIRAVHEQRPRRIVVAVPVAPLEVYHDIQSEVDEVVAVLTPENFCAVGEWYADFSQTTDDEVRELLQRAQMNLKPVVL